MDRIVKRKANCSGHETSDDDDDCWRLLSTQQFFSATVNIDIFALYIFLHNSRFLNIHENMYTSKITFIIA